MKTVLLEPHYFPCLAYFSALSNAERVILEKHEHFVKQSYRNRCYLNTSHGTSALIVPLTGKHGKVCFADVRIDYSQKWLNNHWRTLYSAYGKAPYFEYYSDDIKEMLYAGAAHLYDLNRTLLTLCLRWLGWSIEVQETLSYEEKYSDDVYDLRSVIAPKKPQFIERIYRAVPYYQIFGNAFAENLSILDLILCCGPEASRILKLSSMSDEQIKD